jgi:hypothetical protein
MDMARPHRFTLQAAVTKAASYTLAPADQGLHRYRELIINLAITAAERDSADETYDLWITTEDEGGASWDLCCFPQVATTGVKTFVARLLGNQVLPQTVTTAAPGVPVIESGTLSVATGGANVVGSLGAGLVRHGLWGRKMGYKLTIAGTVVTGIAYSITVEAR